jgi:hypothetical protein
MMRLSSNPFLLAAALWLLAACSNGSGSTNTGKPKTDSPPVHAVQAPAFNADTAFALVERQLAFGPRITGTPAHRRCADWFIARLRAAGATVQDQPFAANVGGNKAPGRNIIAQFHADRKVRVMLSAHYDSRHVADRDSIPANKTKPVPGANDGASGVAVLLEIARTLAAKDPGIGIDIMLWDAEDYGSSGSDDSWCQGSQYWARNMLPKNYKAQYGILLDMVGADGAQFTQEGYSRQFAAGVLANVWQTAHRIGYGGYFLFAPDGELIDDHLHLNQIAGIPTIDIIHRDLNTSDFFAHHHRVTDDIRNIRRETLKAVGQTLLEVIYQEGARAQATAKK